MFMPGSSVEEIQEPGLDTIDRHDLKVEQYPFRLAETHRSREGEIARLRRPRS